MPKTKRNSIPKNESKKDRFLRVCKPRVQKAIKGIRLIALCASNNYESTPKDVATLTAALRAEIDTLEKRFKTPARQETIQFDF